MNHRTLTIAVGLSALVVSAAPPFSGAGTHRRRHQREDPEGSTGQLENPQDDALPDGCVRAAVDRLAQPEGCGRVGRQRDGVLGLHERSPRTVGLCAGRDGRTTWLSARSCRRSRTSSSSKCWRGRRALTARSRRRPSTSSRPTSPRRTSSRSIWRASRPACRTPSCSSDAPGPSRSTSSRRPSARRMMSCGGATAALLAAGDEMGAADVAAAIPRRLAKARCPPTT